MAPAQVIRKHYATEMAVERTRLLYQGSLLPTLLMLVNGLVCAWLLWNPKQYLLVSIWLVWLLALVAMRVIQVAAFDSAMPSRQAQPIWRRMFMLGSAVSGLTLADCGHRPGAGRQLHAAGLGVRPDRRGDVVGQRGLRREPAGVSVLRRAVPGAVHRLSVLGWRPAATRLGLCSA